MFNYELTEQEEIELVKIIRAARHIQKLLWGKLNEGFGLEEWRRMFRKRVAKIDAIDATNPYAMVELKKRVLQVGALSVGFLAILEKQGYLPEYKENEPVTNLPGYVAKVSETKRR